MSRRNCLRCNTPFKSSGPGNRICPTCNKHNTRRRYVKVFRCDIEPPPPPEIPVIVEVELGKKKKNDKKSCS
jgi:hypothetical protein